MKLKSLSTNAPLVASWISMSIVFDPSSALRENVATRAIAFGADGVTIVVKNRPVVVAGIVIR